MRLFFLLIIAAFLGMCFYVGLRSWQALPRRRWMRVAWVAAFVGLTLSMFLGFFLRRSGVADTALFRWVQHAGAGWRFAIIYWFCFALFFDVLRLVDWKFRILPAWVKKHPERARGGALVFSIVAVPVVFAWGYWHFINPVTTRVAINVAKPAGQMRVLRAVVASDLHLGETIGRERLADYVRRINALTPDIILLPGDQVDSRLAPLIRENMGEELKKLRAPLGVYAILGNHERYAGADACIAWMEAQGIRVLRDRAVKVADAFYLVGREDDRRRKSMHELLAPLDRSLPVIVLDHQPQDLDEPAAAGVDLQLSGHTHGGQIWPITWIVPWLYEFYYGYGRKGDYQIYVTSGLGLWGFPARIGSKSELVDLTVRFGTK